MQIGAAPAAILTLRFTGEVVALVALAMAGWQLPGGGPASWICGVLAPLVAATWWGSFVAPKAARRVRASRRVLAEAVVVVPAAVAAGYVWEPWIGAAYGIAMLAVGVVAGRIAPAH